MDEGFDGVLWSWACGASGRSAACRHCVSGFSFAAAAEEQGNAISAELRFGLVACFVSCEATIGEYAAARKCAIAAMRMKRLERHVLTIIFSPIEMFGGPGR